MNSVGLRFLSLTALATLAGCSQLPSQLSSSETIFLHLNQRVLLNQQLNQYSNQAPVLEYIQTCTIQTGQTQLCGFAYSDHLENYLIIEVCPSRQLISQQPNRPLDPYEGIYTITPDGTVTHYPWYNKQFNRWSCLAKRGDSSEEAKYGVMLGNSKNNIQAIGYRYQIESQQGVHQLQTTPDGKLTAINQ
ncbi:hypothetical protein H0A36_17060 [Endozoicomonas sp. SM1973]|uniref:Lipoprotein n=1 Tax=Spartinivicinus marinus TaxID=2994442 RepID=A0A853IEY4_9GAMM|nr:hypothetical protein [Spartinivicinus marinus]MCX4029105.1 hypothetical protein [Spartinivicinus marinus]NYZ67725.1 hypothetical protein [Spartinivicinus marinus]